MKLQYSATHSGFRRLARDLRHKPDRFLAFEVFAPPRFGGRRFMNALLTELRAGSSAGTGPTEFRHLRYRVDDAADPRKAARAWLESQLAPPPEGERHRVVLEVRDFDRSGLDPQVSAECLRGFDDVALAFENGEQPEGLSLAVVIRTRRRHLGRFPLVKLKGGITGSLIESRFLYAVAMHLLTFDETRKIIADAVRDTAGNESTTTALAKVTGGHPALINTAVDSLLYAPDISLEDRLIELSSDAQAAFTSIWENTDPSERFVLFAAATLESRNLASELPPAAEWADTMSKEGWAPIARMASGFLPALEELRILKTGDDGLPRLFSPLFTIWLLRFAHGLRLDSVETLEGKLEMTFPEKKSTYMQVIDAVLAPVYEKVRDEGTKKIADTVLTGGPTVVANLLISALT